MQDCFLFIIGSSFQYNFFAGAYTIPCESQSKLRNVAFYFGNNRYDIEPENYAAKVCPTHTISHLELLTICIA